MTLIGWLLDGFEKAGKAIFPMEKPEYKTVTFKDFAKITAHFNVNPPHLTNPPLRAAMQWEQAAKLIHDMPDAMEEPEWRDLAATLHKVARHVEDIPIGAKTCTFPLDMFKQLNNGMALLYGACDIYRGMKPDYYNVVVLRKDKNPVENPFSQKFNDLELFTGKLRVFLKDSIFDPPPAQANRRPVGLPGRRP